MLTVLGRRRATLTSSVDRPKSSFQRPRTLSSLEASLRIVLSAFRPLFYWLYLFITCGTVLQASGSKTERPSIKAYCKLFWEQLGAAPSIHPQIPGVWRSMGKAALHGQRFSYEQCNTSKVLLIPLRLLSPSHRLHVIRGIPFCDGHWQWHSTAKSLGWRSP